MKGYCFYPLGTLLFPRWFGTKYKLERCSVLLHPQRMKVLSYSLFLNVVGFWVQHVQSSQLSLPLFSGTTATRGIIMTCLVSTGGKVGSLALPVLELSGGTLEIDTETQVYKKKKIHILKLSQLFFSSFQLWTSLEVIFLI
jgi:hypothetical protein